MFDLNTLAEFSRENCVGICTFLVPANLLTVLLTASLALLHRPISQVLQAALLGSFFAVGMVLHVYTWFAIGVVMAPTYVLLSLAITCLVCNWGAVWFRLRKTPDLFALINLKSEIGRLWNF